MDKKKFKNSGDDDIKGFEEFIEGQTNESNFLPRGVGGGKKNELGFEHFTFLVNDASRLVKLKHLFAQKLSFSSKFDQSPRLIQEQKEEIDILRKKLFDFSDKEKSPYRKSLGEIFNSFFEPPQS